MMDQRREEIFLPQIREDIGHPRWEYELNRLLDLAPREVRDLFEDSGCLTCCTPSVTK
jgi:hypothetical protein